jgi:hypothetical protein
LPDAGLVWFESFRLPRLKRFYETDGVSERLFFALSPVNRGKMMRRICCNLLLIAGLVLALGWLTDVSAQGRRPRNAGILSVQTTPAAYPVLVNGVSIGMSGVAAPAEFYLEPGFHKIEVQGPAGQTFAKEIEIRRGVRNCICLRVVENTIKRPCPYDVRVEAPANVREGDLITFAAINAVTASTPLNYRWRVTPEAARITSGLGTPSITVDSTGLGGQTITAELDVTDDVSGATCFQKNSVRTTIEKIIIPQPERVLCDEFESKTFDDDKGRFDNCVIQIQNRPDAQLYIIVYQGADRISRTRNTADRLSKRTLDYLVRARGVDPRRVQIIRGGTRPKTTFQLWIVPPGAALPVPNE